MTLQQTRKCEDCKVFFHVPAAIDARTAGPAQHRARTSGPWTCPKCQVHPMPKQLSLPSVDWVRRKKAS